MKVKYFSFDYYRLKRIRAILEKVNGLASRMAKLSDEDLRQKTVEFRQRLKQGETLDELLPEAFAVVREADKRVLGQYPYDEQVMGAIVLHQGDIAEMKTGEGKTLVATMPLYLHALTGKGAMLITNNTYLACRDGSEMKGVYEFLGLTTAIAVSEIPGKTFTVAEKQQIYNSDVIYTTNSGLGFDYLIDNLADSPQKKFMKELNYCIIDEADAVLLDSAQMPLVISGAPRVQSNLYQIVDKFIYTLVGDDYYFLDKDENEVWLTQKGIDEANKYFATKQLFTSDEHHRNLVRHINLALRAHTLYRKNKDYLVDAGEIKLIDKREGRILEMTKMQAGQHQALEAKEGLAISQEMRAIASITYQNLFVLFKRYGGMTGTGKSDEAEFIDVYDKEVVQIPTHKPVQRRDLPDRIFTSEPEKKMALLSHVRELHEKGQPVLLITGSVKASEHFSDMLLLDGIPHNLLNAQSEAKEAEIISEAGQKGAVTVATMMAGRGTDIKLSDEARALGGLAVIVSERMASKRMDLQIRGRSGRQGDPGLSQFFVSLEDDLLVDWGNPNTKSIIKKKFRRKKCPIQTNYCLLSLKRGVNAAQKASDEYGRLSRRDTLQFDDSLKMQRELVYAERNKILGNALDDYDLRDIVEAFVDQFLHGKGVHITRKELMSFVLENISYDFDSSVFLKDEWLIAEAKELVMQLVDSKFAEKEQLLSTKDRLNSFKRVALLKAVDEAWIEEVDYLQQLRVIVSSRRSAQRNPVYEYHKEALKSFDEMLQSIKELAVRNILLSEVTVDKNQKMNIYFA